jgi:predicted nuclease of predicted toxin-antitoxin system
MRFLADESCDFRVIRALRAAGHDVVAVVEVAPGAEDETVIDLSVDEQWILLTEDRDFGQLVYANAKAALGVVLLRFPTNTRAGLPALLVEIVAQHAEKLVGSFTVVRPGRVRFGIIPKD